MGACGTKLNQFKDVTRVNTDARHHPVPHLFVLFPPATMNAHSPHPRLTWLASAALLALAGTPAQADPSAPLQTVVVSATRHAMPLVDAPAAMSVITAEDIAQRGAAAH